MKIIVNGSIIETDWIIEVGSIKEWKDQMGYQFTIKYVNEIESLFRFFYQDYGDFDNFTPPKGEPYSILLESALKERNERAYTLALEDATKIRDFIVSHWSKDSLRNIPQISQKEKD